jgi:hypothetical protein
VNDILVYSRTKEEHEEHISMVLQVLRENQLYAKFRKCDFFQNKIWYLGHIISVEGVAVDPEKISTIMDWTTPRNLSEVRSFMVLDGYYRRFIKEFSNIGNPITSLHRKGKKFVWSSECEDRFRQLKHILTNAPVLKITNLENDFLI